MKNLWRALTAVAVGALMIGVAVAWAGVPHLRTTDSTLDSGTTTKGGGGKGGTTTLSAARTTEAASANDLGYAPATIFVHFSATGVSGTPYFVPTATGTATWACGNNGGGFPADPKKTTDPLDPTVDAEAIGADRKGKIVYTGDGITLTLVPEATFTCPSGQTALLVELTLDSLTLSVYESQAAYVGGAAALITWDVNLPSDFVDGTWTRPDWVG